MGKNTYKMDIREVLFDKENFVYAVFFFVDSLRKKRDWRSLEQRISKYDIPDLADVNIRKLFEWERQAYNLYIKSQDLSLDFISQFAKTLSNEEAEKLKGWIQNSDDSKEAWEKHKITINEPMNIIEARVAHLIYMSWSPDRVNIGDIIESKNSQ